MPAPLSTFDTDDFSLGMPDISQRKRPKTDDEIDITPMIDMVFLLLIFFIVCSTMQQQSSIELPRTDFGVTVSERNAVVISIEGKGRNVRVFLGDNMGSEPLPDATQVQESEIAKAVEAGHREGKDTIVIKADREVHHGEVSRIANIATGAIEGMRLYMATNDENNE